MLRNKNRRRLAVENLEGRRLMAGDLSVNFDGEKLEIKGDDLPNQVAVFARGGDLIVDGLGTTTINGISDGTGTNLGSAAGLIDIVIETFGGSDRVLVRDLAVADSLEIKTGDGNDFVAVSRVVAGNDLKIETKAGADTVQVSRVLAGNSVEVDSGLGNDAVTVLSVSAGNDLKVETKEGNDTVTVNSVRSVTGKVLLDGGSGFDELNLGAVFGELEIKDFEL